MTGNFYTKEKIIQNNFTWIVNVSAKKQSLFLIEVYIYLITIFADITELMF